MIGTFDYRQNCTIPCIIPAGMPDNGCPVIIFPKDRYAISVGVEYSFVMTLTREATYTIDTVVYRVAHADIIADTDGREAGFLDKILCTSVGAQRTMLGDRMPGLQAIKDRIVEPKQGDRKALWTGMVSLCIPRSATLSDDADGEFIQALYRVDVNKNTEAVRMRVYGDSDSDCCVVYGSANIYHERRSNKADDLMLCIDVFPSEQRVSGHRIEFVSNGFRSKERSYVCFPIFGYGNYSLAIGPRPKPKIELVPVNIAFENALARELEAA